MIRRAYKSAADYLAIAVCPLLIMALVWSLVFFLVEIGYAGGSGGRLRWTLFWFVLALVLVTRIAMERSSAAAWVYGAALAGATSLMLLQYLGFVLMVWLILGLIWWAAHKLTWDSTLIDEDEDSSGQGLMRASGLEKLPAKKLAGSRPGRSGRALTSFAPRAVAAGVSQPRAVEGPGFALPGTQSQKHPHAPGRWVLYFALAAPPVFGLGEVFLSRDDVEGRMTGFLLLNLYLGAAGGLLLLTSFLGLRRYLRQRFLAMPPAIAWSWVGSGLAVLALLFLLAFLLPRPSTPYSLAESVNRLKSPAARTADREPQTDNGTDVETRREGKSPPGQTGTESAPATKKDQAAPSAGDAGASRRPDPGSNQGSRGDPSGAPRSASGNDPSLGSLRWLGWILAAIIAGALLWRFRSTLAEALRAAWREWLEFWRGVFGRRRQEGEDGRASSLSARAKQRRALEDPFSDGRAERLSLGELVRLTFDGARVWADERGEPRLDSETPLEFVERLGLLVEPSVAGEFQVLGRLYSQLSYGDILPPESSRETLRGIWLILGTSPMAGQGQPRRG